MIRAWRLITILFVGLSMGMAFCHLLQMAPRMQYWFLYRAQWEFTHAMRAIFEIVAFTLLIVSVLVETPKDGISRKSQSTNVSAENNSQIKFGSFLIGIFNSLLGFWAVAPSKSFARRARLELAHVHGVIGLRTGPINRALFFEPMGLCRWK
ncbi:hypothetical protein L0152_23815 [bacterium]|nr:hypothetical protein [bacterium]